LIDEIIGFSPLMNIDKLIHDELQLAYIHSFSPLMNIDKLTASPVDPAIQLDRPEAQQMLRGDISKEA
jgi:hypothetical protein